MIKMRKNFWMLAAVLFSCGLAQLMVSCTNSDNIVVYDDNSEKNFVPAVPTPTADQLKVKIDGLTYVMDAQYADEGKALVNRVVNRAATIDDPNLSNIIIYAPQCDKLTHNDCAAIIRLMANGGSLVMVEPTPQLQWNLLAMLFNVASAHLDDSNPHPLLEDLDYDNLLWFTSYADYYCEQLEDKESYDDLILVENPDDHSACVVALRDNDVYVGMNQYDNETTEEVYNIVLPDVQGNDSVSYQVTMPKSKEVSDFIFGCHADELAEWLNTPEETAAARQAARYAAAQQIATRAGGTAEQYIDRIAQSQDYHLMMGGRVTFMNDLAGMIRYHKVLLDRHVYAAYSHEQKRDYYCVDQTITLKNQDLECGPDKKDEWFNPYHWETWQKADGPEWGSIKRQYLYGPYMRKFNIEVGFDKNSNVNPRIEQYVPTNSTTGGHTESNGINYSLGGSLGVSGSGPSLNLSGNVTWTHSVSRVVSDINMTASTTDAGALKWKYEAPGRPKAVYRAFQCAAHEDPTAIQRQEMVVQQAWVWSVATDKQTINLYTDYLLEDEFMSFAGGYFGTFYYKEFYMQKEFNNSTPDMDASDNYTLSRVQNILCPPRFKQTWSMSITTANTNVDVAKLEQRLKEKLPAYFMDSYTFCTYKKEHKENADKLDPVRTFLNKAFNAFDHNNNVKEILRECGTFAGMPADGKFTITWRHTDPDANSDRIVYEFNMKEEK